MDKIISKENGIDEIIKRYERRAGLPGNMYSLLNPYVYLSGQEKERTIIKCLKKVHLKAFENKKILEIGCGNGSNLFLFLKLGFEPENIFANELIKERINKAKSILPSQIHFYQGDALSLDFSDNYFDIIYQSVVFTSIIDPGVKAELAKKIWNLLKPGGAILWFDFIYNNPVNPDVRGIPLREIKKLFPAGHILKWKIILAPPVGRFVTRLVPALYNLFNVFPFLRTHLLCWIEKPH